MCGSVFGLLSIALTLTYWPPIWAITFAYLLSAPTARIVWVAAVAGVLPASANATPVRSAAATEARAGLRFMVLPDSCVLSRPA